jgi:hypothetical protein
MMLFPLGSLLTLSLVGAMATSRWSEKNDVYIKIRRGLVYGNRVHILKKVLKNSEMLHVSMTDIFL